jgi:KamA family protein
MPIVIPQRITDALVRMLRECRLTPWFVIHSNHAAELDSFTLQHLKRLTDSGIPILNQAVLLRGVNDTEQALEDLCRRLINHRIQPYYLHQLDRVQGAQHFEVSDARALQLVSHLTAKLPGYAVPKLVREISGEPAKSAILPEPDPFSNRA